MLFDGRLEALCLLAVCRWPYCVRDVLMAEQKRCGGCGCIKPMAEFYKRRNRKNGHQSRCKTCAHQLREEWQKQNVDTCNAYARQWLKSNPERARENRRRGRLKFKYGISPADYDHIWAAQDGKCAICGERKNLHIDHIHGTKIVRQLLCPDCNANFIGRLEKYPERMEKAKAYIARHAAYAAFGLTSLS